MKGTDIALLAGVGIVGYGLINSNFFKGVGEVGTGVGDAVGGVGSGVGFAGQSAGYNLGEIFEAFGQFGQSTREIIREGGLHTREIIREGGETIVDIQEEVHEDIVPTVDYAGDIPRNLFEAGSNLSGNVRNIFTEYGNKVEGFSSGVLNAPENVFSWVKEQASNVVEKAKSLRSPSITGAVISSGSSSNESNTNKSIRSSPIQTSQPNQFLEKLGYQGTSTLNGVVYTQPAVKLPWN